MRKQTAERMVFFSGVVPPLRRIMTIDLQQVSQAWLQLRDEKMGGRHHVALEQPHEAKGEDRLLGFWSKSRETDDGAKVSLCDAESRLDYQPGWIYGR
jgi:hypothetical protein